MGISVDTVEQAAALHARERYNFALLSDPDRRVVDAYGTHAEARDISVPVVYLIDTEGQIRWRYLSENKADRPSAEALLEALGKL